MRTNPESLAKTITIIHSSNSNLILGFVVGAKEKRIKFAVRVFRT